MRACLSSLIGGCVLWSSIVVCCLLFVELRLLSVVCRLWCVACLLCVGYSCLL